MESICHGDRKQLTAMATETSCPLQRAAPLCTSRVAAVHDAPGEHPADPIAMPIAMPIAVPTAMPTAMPIADPSADPSVVE